MDEKPPDIAIQEITVELAGGKFLTITTLARAGEYLLKEWPGERGPKHIAAQVAILDALEGNRSGGAARIAFIEAIEEGGIFILDVKRPAPTGKIEHWHKKRPRRRWKSIRTRAQLGVQHLQLIAFDPPDTAS